MKKQLLYVTEDGRTFTNKAQAIEHEIQWAIDWELVTKLKLTTATARVIAQNYKEIARIIGTISGKGKKVATTEEDKNTL